jgi:hypothetical protein
LVDAAVDAAAQFHRRIGFVGGQDLVSLLRRKSDDVISWVVARSRIELVPGPTDQMPTSMVPSRRALALSVKESRLSL